MYDLEKDKDFLDNFEQEMEDFDDCLTRTLDVYLEYLRSFVMMIQVLIKDNLEIKNSLFSSRVTLLC